MSRRYVAGARTIARGFLLSLLLVFAPIVTQRTAAQNGSSDKPQKVTEGLLVASAPDGRSLGVCPLAHTAVKAQISGFMSRVRVTQEFQNPYAEKIEAVYMFPLPENAAVDDMRIQVGDHVVVGRIMRRGEAREVYEQARAQGQVAALLDQERPNIFTQSVANIMPGEKITVQISYVETLKYEDGSYEFVFPMVVGPRYNPAPTPHVLNTDTADKVTAPEADSDPTISIEQEQNSPQPSPSGSAAPAAIPPPVLPPAGMRAGHDVSLELDVDAGVPINEFKAKSHEVNVERQTASRAVIRLKDEAVIPNQDFVFRYDVAGQTVSDAILTHKDERGGYFTMILQPPDRVTMADITPKELVFVVDTSGSMGGFPLEHARATILYALEHLNPGDTFNLITFSGDEHILFKEPVPATPENIEQAKNFLASREASGGTEMMKAIRAALDPSDAQNHLRIVCFATDGQVGNDQEIIAEVQKHQNARVFALGFGYSPNRFLLDKMAEYGRGEVDYIAGTDAGQKAAERFYERVRDPLLTNITVDWGGLPVTDVYPKRINDLFRSKPVVLSGRFAGDAKGTIRLRGMMSGREVVREIPVDLGAANDEHDTLATLWARRKIDDLIAQDYDGAARGQMKDGLDEAVTQIGLEYRLMTQFTSFVAVDESMVTPGGEPTRVDVPVEAVDPQTGAPLSTGQFSNFPSQRTVQSLYSIAPTTARAGLRDTGGAANAVSVAGSGGVSATVNVSAGYAMLNTTDQQLSTIIDSRQILELPLNGRNPVSLVQMAPGAVASGSGTLSADQPGGPTIGGARSAQNSFLLDGVASPVNGTTTPPAQLTAPGASANGLSAAGGMNSVAPLDMIQEMRITTYNGQAEIGQSNGAQVSVTSKSGTNEFHGHLFSEFGNSAFDANDWFANSLGLRQPAGHMSTFGGSFGGPIKRDRSFFFGTYEGLRLRQPFFARADVPSLASRLAAPAALRPFLNAYSLPTGAARADGFADFAATFSNPARHDLGRFRLDQVINQRISVTGFYGFADSDATERGGNGFALNSLERNDLRTQNASAMMAVSVSPNVIFDVAGGYSRTTARNSRWLDGFGGAVVPLGSSFFSANAVGFDLTGRNSALWSSDRVENLREQFNLLGDAILIQGNHTLKFGGDYRRAFYTIGNRPSVQSVTFNGIAGALTGTATRWNQYARAGEQRPVFNSFALYAQDTFRWTPELTLNFGLRWELAPSPSNGSGDDPAAIVRTTDPSQLQLAPAGTRLWETSFSNFAPRVGFNYTRQWRGKLTVFSGGAGIFYDAQNESTVTAFGDSYPFLRSNFAYNVPFPAGPVGAPVRSTATAPLVVFAPDLKMPYSIQWNVSVQQEMTSQDRLAIAYVGSSGRRLWLTQTLIDPAPGFGFVRLTDNRGRSDHRSLQITYDRRLAQGLQIVTQYTFGRTRDNIGGDSSGRSLLLSPDLAAERGPSDFDTRHSLAAWVSYEVPESTGSGFKHTLLHNWGIDGALESRSAQPLNIVYGYQTNFGFAYLRPDLVAGVPLYLNAPTAAGGRRLNPAAFAIPATVRQGTLGRNTLRGFPFTQLDLSLRRKVDLSESVRLQFKAEVYNLLNHANFADPAGTENSLGNFFVADPTFAPNATFGQTTAMNGRSLWGSSGRSFNSYYLGGGPRTLQFSVRFEF